MSRHVSNNKDLEDHVVNYLFAIFFTNNEYSDNNSIDEVIPRWSLINIMLF